MGASARWSWSESVSAIPGAAQYTPLLRPGVRTCHSVMSRGKREALVDHPTRARVRWTCAVYADVKDIYWSLASVMSDSLMSTLCSNATAVACRI